MPLTPTKGDFPWHFKTPQTPSRLSCCLADFLYLLGNCGPMSSNGGPLWSSRSDSFPNQLAR